MWQVLLPAVISSTIEDWGVGRETNAIASISPPQEKGILKWVRDKMKSLCMQSVPPFLECGAFIERNEQDDKMNLLGLNTFLFLVPLCPQCRRPGFDPWVWQIPWRRNWQPTPVLLPRKFHGWRTLVGCSPWDHKAWDTTERLHFLSFWFPFMFSLLWFFFHGTGILGPVSKTYLDKGTLLPLEDHKR